jgi:hypothetical protein
MLHFSALLLCAVALIHSAAAADERIALSNGQAVDFVGKSAKFKLYVNASDPSSAFIMVSPGKIQELDATGRAVSQRSVNALASQHGDFTVQYDAVVPGSSPSVRAAAVTLNYTAISFPGPKSGPTAALSMTFYLINTTTNVKYGNETLLVPSDAVKFTFSSSAWPFDDARNSLSVAFDLKSSDDGNATTAGAMPGNATGQSFSIGQGVLDMPSTVIVDGQARNASVTLDSNGNKQSVQVIMPHFSTSLVYDPVLTSSTAYPNPSPGPSATAHPMHPDSAAAAASVGVALLPVLYAAVVLAA